MSIKVKHEFVGVPTGRCADLEVAVDELRRAQVRAQEVSFDGLPTFYRQLPAWRTLAHHLLPGARRSYSEEAAAASLGAALAERTGLDWSWLDTLAHLLSPGDTTQAAGALAEVAADPGGPSAVVMEGLTRFLRLSDGQLAEWRPIVAAELACPDGGDHGAPGELVELLRSLVAALRDAAERGDGLLYLNYSPALIPT